ncbi:MAG: tetraacyldisaccharide 4'-kinase, partial [Flammeovirgaceae bacterium]
GAARADAIVVTKCDSNVELRAEINREVKSYAGNKPVFFSGLKYRPAVPFGQLNNVGKKVLLVTGIANPTPLVKYVTTHFELVKHVHLPDHHHYTVVDIQRIEAALGTTKADSIVTTEKDWVKLKSEELINTLNRQKWFYLPIETDFINCGAEFDTMVELLVKKRLHELD